MDIILPQRHANLDLHLAVDRDLLASDMFIPQPRRGPRYGLLRPPLAQRVPEVVAELPVLEPHKHRLRIVHHEPHAHPVHPSLAFHHVGALAKSLFACAVPVELVRLGVYAFAAQDACVFVHIDARDPVVVPAFLVRDLSAGCVLVLATTFLACDGTVSELAGARGPLGTVLRLHRYHRDSRHVLAIHTVHGDGKLRLRRRRLTQHQRPIVRRA
ncbi:hypothetical protein EXIGLDRAFT_192498 [Exidia glandulosa HHB12029]|uniref:Uncharacterized protein n=1 Tax=Exidia glandulosa HHB12029 TaxID=1314781 RepID=A0A165EX00_EXIGL|nr:hypothetical protein EXIGLDRAFT_192498 [Exidia glandulosa HHB12029]